MLAAFLLNGTCPFGLRILAGWGLADQYTAVYLVYWYLAGFVFGLVGLISARHRLTRANLLIGLVMRQADPHRSRVWGPVLDAQQVAARTFQGTHRQHLRARWRDFHEACACSLELWLPPHAVSADRDER